MVFKRFQAFAQIVGFVCIALLAVYGLIAAFSGSSLARAFTNPANVASTPALAPHSPSAMTVPGMVNYQGMLRDAEGTPLSGYYTLTFQIYDDVIAGTSLWSEQHISVTVRDGRFATLLGDHGSPLSAGLFNSPDRFIGVTVDPYTEMVPRQRFASTPYSIQAEEAFHASNADNATHADHANALSASDGDPLDAVTVDADGKVGVGTTTPSQKLDVNGSLNVNNSIDWSGHLLGMTVSGEATRTSDDTIIGPIATGGNQMCYLTGVDFSDSAVSGNSSCSITWFCPGFPNPCGWWLNANAPSGELVTCTARCLSW